MKKYLALFLVVIVAFSVVACGPKEVEEPVEDVEETVAEETEAEETEEPASEEADDGIVVGWLQKNTSNVFETYINAGGEAYLDQMVEEGVIEDYITFDGNTDPSTQINQANDLVNLGVDVAILQPAEAEGSAPALEILVDAGIPTVVVNARTINTDDLAVSYVGSDDVNAGEIMGQFIIDTLGEEGSYGHLMGMMGNSAAIQRAEGVHNILDQYPGWELLAEVDAEWSGDKASKFTQDWIQAYGDDLDAIICANDDMSVAAKSAAIAAGREDIVVIGVDAIEAALSMVQAGELEATVFQDGLGQGSGAASTAVEVALGNEVSKEQWIPFVLVTLDNIADFVD